jgi:hypothetical protein
MSRALPATGAIPAKIARHPGELAETADFLCPLAPNFLPLTPPCRSRARSLLAIPLRLDWLVSSHICPIVANKINRPE